LKRGGIRVRLRGWRFGDCRVPGVGCRVHSLFQRIETVAALFKMLSKRAAQFLWCPGLDVEVP